MLHMCVLFSLEGEDKMSHYCIIVLGVSTLGTSVLLWWMYKYFSGKDKYDVEGMYLYFIVSGTYLDQTNLKLLACMYIVQVVMYKVIW